MKIILTGSFAFQTVGFLLRRIINKTCSSISPFHIKVKRTMPLQTSKYPEEQQCKEPYISKMNPSNIALTTIICNLWSLISFHHVTIEIANSDLNISTISQWFILHCFMHSYESGWLIGNYGIIGIWRHDCCMHYTWGMQPMGHLITRIYNSLLYSIPD